VVKARLIYSLIESSVAITCKKGRLFTVPVKSDLRISSILRYFRSKYCESHIPLKVL
jgi:hypothetical protein